MKLRCKVIREQKERGTGADFPHVTWWKCRDGAIGAKRSSILLYQLTRDEEARYGGAAVGTFVELTIYDLRRPPVGPVRARGTISQFGCIFHPTPWPVHTQSELFILEPQLITRLPLMHVPERRPAS